MPAPDPEPSALPESVLRAPSGPVTTTLIPLITPTTVPSGPVTILYIPPTATYRAPSGLVDIDCATPPSDNSVLYMIQADIRPFNPAVAPPMTRPKSFNDDLQLGSFRHRKLAWSEEQRRGIAMHITDAVSIEGHVMKALGLEFFLAKDIPLPTEMETAMGRVISTPYHFRWNSGTNKWAASKKW